MNKLKNSKIILVLSVLLVFIVMGSASAVDETGNETVSTPETGVDTLSMGVDNVNNRVSAAESTNNLVANDTRNNDLLGLSNSELLSADIKSFSDLKNEITNGGSSITLSGNYYQYTSADGDNYAINVTNKIINGNGATIDGSNLSYPFVSSGYSTFKNINFINVKTTNSSYSANYQGGPIIFDVGSSNVIFDNCNFTKLTTTINAAGAIGLPKGNNITIKNCNFYDNTVFNTLIIFYNDGYVNENITIENCKFDNIVSTKSNGILWGSSVKNFTMKNCEFINNTPKNMLVYFGNLNVSFIDNCYFNNNGNNWAFNVNAYNTTISNTIINNTKGITGRLNDSNITNCTFVNIGAPNVQTGQGIAIYTSESTNFNIIDSKFINITASANNGGAVLLAKGFGGTVVSCDFVNCSTGTSGGAINFNANPENMTVVYCNFTECHSGLNGGAVEFYAPNSIVDHCIFKGNYITAQRTPGKTPHPFGGRDWDGHFGGAIVIFSQAYNQTITNCEFYDNWINTSKPSSDVYCDGGAIGITSRNNTHIYIENCTFSNNTARNGGALAFNSDHSYIKNSTFINNTGTKTGGAIYSNAKNCTIEDSFFQNNTAPDGMDFYKTNNGEIFFNSYVAVLWLTNNNTGLTVASAHGLRLSDPAAWDDDALNFLDTSRDKVTVYLVGNITSLPEKLLSIPNLEIIGYDPVNNPVGATLNMSGWNHRAFTVGANNIKFTNITFKNSNITEDTSNPNGGVIYITANNTLIDGCSFYNNSAVNGSCIIMVSGDILTVKNSTFNGNNASYGGAIYINNCTNQSIIYTSTFENNVAHLGAGIYYNETIWYTEEDNTYKNNKITNTDSEMISKYTDVYDLEANRTYRIVYVKIGGDGLGNEPEHPTTFAKGFDMVAPNGQIIFVENGETHTYPEISRTNGKFGITFTGNNTTLIGITFINSIQGYNVTITDFHFINNNSCVIWQGRDGNIVNCTFTSKDESALILTDEANSVDITNSSFINNTNRALTIETHDVVLDNCTFKNNTVNTGSGSHILMTNNATNIIVKDSRFIEGNKTGILVNASNVEFSNSNFTHNTGENGGAIQQINGTLSLNGNIFEGNNATDNGGALNLVNGTSSLNDNNFTNNNANNGGAIYNNATLNIIDGVSFTGNNASNGGAIYNNATLNINNAVFNENNATLGGALYLNNNASIKDSSFEGNTAVNGSAIYLTKDNRLELDNVVLKDNTYTEPNDETYGSIYLNNPKNDVLTYTNLNLVDKNDIYDGDYYLNTIYISSNGSPTAWGRDPNEATTLDNAVKHILDNGKIIVTDDSGDFTINQTFNNLTNVTIVGNNKKFKTTDGKYLFNQPKNAKNKKKLCKNISFQSIIYPPK